MAGILEGIIMSLHFLYGIPSRNHVQSQDMKWKVILQGISTAVTPYWRSHLVHLRLHVQSQRSMSKCPYLHVLSHDKSHTDHTRTVPETQKLDRN